MLSATAIYIYITEDKAGFDNDNITIDFNQSALSQVFKTVVFGCLLYCFSGHTTFKVYSANSLTVVPRFEIKSQTFADAILCPGSINREGL